MAEHAKITTYSCSNLTRAHKQLQAQRTMSSCIVAYPKIVASHMPATWSMLPKAEKADSLGPGVKEPSVLECRNPPSRTNA
jgi:hypothetical protein